MNKFATVDLRAPRQTQETRRRSSVVGRPQNHLRTARDVRLRTRSWAHWGAQRARWLAKCRRRSSNG